MGILSLITKEGTILPQSGSLEGWNEELEVSGDGMVRVFVQLGKPTKGSRTTTEMDQVRQRSPGGCDSREIVVQRQGEDRRNRPPISKRP